MKNFYVFEVIEDFRDKMVMFEEINGTFKKGDRFIGYISKNGRGRDIVIKSNLSEIVYIPLDMVKKVYKIEFKQNID